MTIADATPKPDQTPAPVDDSANNAPETIDDPIDRLNLTNETPNVPTQDEMTDPPINLEATIDAPYGFNKDGTPAKKRGRKAAGSTSDQTPLFDRLDSVTQARPLTGAKRAEKPTRPVIPSPQAIATDYRVMGETAANVWFNVGEMAFGEDWQPEPKEPEMIASAFKDYFQAKEIKAIDPTIVLFIALGGYTVKRLNKPTMKSRVAGIGQWLKSKIKR